MNEEWQDIPGFEGRYQISNLGRVKSLARTICGSLSCRKLSERIMRTGRWYGYEMVWLRKGPYRKKYRIHRLVAERFLERPDDPESIEVNHKDKVRSNNVYSNLEWCTHIENCAHRDDEPF